MAAKGDIPQMLAMKRLLRDVLKPSLALGKRNRDADRENVAPSMATPNKVKTNCIALQNEDEDEDAVVITALSSIPFCCHADLLIMSRSELVAAAQVLNTKLPKVMRIDIGETRSDNFIRHSIELLVGIRSEGPGGRKRDRSLSLYAGDFEPSVHQSSTVILPPSPITPLAARSRANGDRSFGESLVNTSRLTSLREEEDEEAYGADRPLKRRRTDDLSLDEMPTPTRSRSMSIQSPIAGNTRHVLRSQSQRLPEGHIAGVHRNVTLTRGSRRGRPQSTAVLTSTPKTRRLLPKVNRVSEPVEQRSFSSLSSVSAATTISPSVSASEERVSGWLQQSSNPGEVQEVTKELKGISLESHSSFSDMDISV